MVVQAGRIVDAADFTPGLGVAQTAYVVKATNESVTSSSTLQSDNDLLYALAASTTYEVEVSLIVTAASAGDFKSAFTVPSGATGTRMCIGPTTVAASFTSSAQTEARFSADTWTATTIYNVDTTGTVIVERGIITTSSAGTLTFRWAQNSSNATATVVQAGSYMKVTRVA